jgi:hypothetical protein
VGDTRKARKLIADLNARADSTTFPAEAEVARRKAREVAEREGLPTKGFSAKASAPRSSDFAAEYLYEEIIMEHVGNGRFTVTVRLRRVG